MKNQFRGQLIQVPGRPLWKILIEVDDRGQAVLNVIGTIIPGPTMADVARTLSVVLASLLQGQIKVINSGEQSTEATASDSNSKPPSAS